MNKCIFFFPEYALILHFRRTRLAVKNDIKYNSGGNVADVLTGASQKSFCLLDPLIDDIVCQREAGLPFEKMRQVIRGKIYHRRQNTTDNEALPLFREQISQFPVDRACSSIPNLRDWVTDALTLYEECIHSCADQDAAVTTVWRGRSAAGYLRIMLSLT